MRLLGKSGDTIPGSHHKTILYILSKLLTFFHELFIIYILDSSCTLDSVQCWPDVIHCTLLSTTRAHQQAINVLKTEAGRVVTGSQDHTLKVFRLDDLFCLYTLHGHEGSITTLFLDTVWIGCLTCKIIYN